MSSVIVNESSLSSIADAIRLKNGTSQQYKPSEMAAAIAAIEAGSSDIPDEAFTITGDAYYFFIGWDWFIKTYGDKITTKDITNAGYMFSRCDTLENIPFELNASPNALTGHSVMYLFDRCSKLTEIPKMNGFIPSQAQGMFDTCRYLRYLPDDLESWFDWSYMDNLTTTSYGSRSSTFRFCNSLRSIPMGFLAHANPNVSYSNSLYNMGFQNCSVLDEIVNIPIPYTATWTSNAFSNTFFGCSRAKKITFETNADGTPKVVKWKNQTIDLSSQVGYCYSSIAADITGYNSGITNDHRVTDANTYNLLKNHPDWWTTIVTYSRYNHDGAVATINSLPDTSAYLATAGGSNTIKFKKTSGQLTDGGAIEGLTAEEIAVATAKGWTVSLVS